MTSMCLVQSQCFVSSKGPGVCYFVNTMSLIINLSLSLVSSPDLQILLDSSSKQYGHVRYWLGLHIGDYFPDMLVGPHADFISPYFQHMRLCWLKNWFLGTLVLELLEGRLPRSCWLATFWGKTWLSCTWPFGKRVYLHDYQQHCSYKREAVREDAHGGLPQLCALQCEERTLLTCLLSASWSGRLGVGQDRGCFHCY